MFKDLYFADPEYFLLAIIIPFALFFWYRFGKLTQATLKQSSLSLLKFNRSFIARLRPFLYVMRIIVILLLITAISRPQSKSTSKRIKSSEKIDIKYLHNAKILKKKYEKIKVLGQGEIKDKLNLEVHFLSNSAKEKLSKNGSTIKILESK